MSADIHIYSLTDPIDISTVYIGRTKDSKNRLRSHWSDRENSVKGKWIRELKERKIKPTIDVLDTVSENEWKFWEKFYISLYKSWGFNLVNGNNGGGGCIHHTDEAKTKISNALKERKHTEEHKRKIGEAQIGKFIPPEVGRKISKALMGHKRTQESIEKQIQNSIGLKRSPEGCKNISESLIGHEVSQETREKISKKNKGRKHSPLARQKMSVSNKGRKKSDSHKKNIGIALTGLVHPPERIKKNSDSQKKAWERRRVNGTHKQTEEHKRKRFESTRKTIAKKIKSERTKR